MSIVKWLNNKLSQAIKEATSVSGQPGMVVINPDGSSIGSSGGSSGLEYNATPPTITDGGTDTLQGDANGNLKTTGATLTAGEDLTNNRLMTRPTYSYSAVAVADVQVKASAGYLHTVTISCNDAAPTAGSVIIYDNTAESGTQIFNHTFTTTPFVPFTVHFDITMATGIYIGFTTTADVNVSCAYL